MPGLPLVNVLSVSCSTMAPLIYAVITFPTIVAFDYVATLDVPRRLLSQLNDPSERGFSVRTKLVE